MKAPQKGSTTLTSAVVDSLCPQPETGRAKESASKEGKGEYLVKFVFILGEGLKGPHPTHPSPSPLPTH